MDTEAILVNSELQINLASDWLTMWHWDWQLIFHITQPIKNTHTYTEGQPEGKHDQTTEYIDNGGGIDTEKQGITSAHTHIHPSLHHGVVKQLRSDRVALTALKNPFAHMDPSHFSLVNFDMFDVQNTNIHSKIILFISSFHIKTDGILAEVKSQWFLKHTHEPHRLQWFDR